MDAAEKDEVRQKLAIAEHTFFTLAKFELAVQVALDRKLLDNCVADGHSLSLYTDHMMDRLFVQLRCFVWADQEREVCYWEHPTTWWDAVKERFAPKWFVRRWPVHYTKCTISARNIYPMLKLSVPSETAVASVAMRADWSRGQKI